ncbi:transcription elongation factor GreA [Howardella ureilytica]|nr:transcription elongation factor GreA [Lachnospiraceae bacterium]MDY2956213.1 transcription elongation factor GreA [Lachnospiraceae bacterium]
MAEKNWITKEGYEAKKARLEHLMTVERQEIIKKIGEAKEQGDLSENAEYEAAREEQGKIEGEISKLEAELKNCQIIDEEKSGDNKVAFGSVVTLKDLEYDEELEYKLVGPLEASILDNKISIESPIGKLILGREVGDIVSAASPAGGIIEYKILAVKND